MRTTLSKSAMGLWNLSASPFHKSLSAKEGKDLIKAAYRRGIRIFDTAYSYGDASSVLAAALKELKAEDALIISKVMPVPTIRRKTEAELKRLNRPPDILLLHWPAEEKQLTAGLEDLTRVKEEGKAKAIGVSNVPLPLLRWITERFPVEYHERPLSLIWTKDWQEEKSMDLKTIAYSPLGMGILSGKYRSVSEITDRRSSLPVFSSPFLQNILDAVHNKPELALSWVYSEQPWCVVSGFSSQEQLSILNMIYPVDDSSLTILADKFSKSIPADNIFGHNWH